MGGKSEGGSGQREGGAKDLEEGTKVVGGCCGFAARVQNGWLFPSCWAGFGLRRMYHSPPTLLVPRLSLYYLR